MMKNRVFIWVFIIAFTGMLGILTVDKECFICTGEGGKLGLSVSRTAEGNTGVCFFGIEGEIPL